jgi:hypothetical protein
MRGHLEGLAGLRITTVLVGDDGVARRCRAESETRAAVARVAVWTADDFADLEVEAEQERRDAYHSRAIAEAFQGVGGGFLRCAWQRMRPRVLEIVADLVLAAERRGRGQGRAEERRACLAENSQRRSAYPDGIWSRCTD